jgi:hypothetical protein
VIGEHRVAGALVDGDEVAARWADLPPAEEPLRQGTQAAARGGSARKDGVRAGGPGLDGAHGGLAAGRLEEDRRRRVCQLHGVGGESTSRAPDSG